MEASEQPGGTAPEAAPKKDGTEYVILEEVELFRKLDDGTYEPVLANIAYKGTLKAHGPEQGRRQAFAKLAGSRGEGAEVGKVRAVPSSSWQGKKYKPKMTLVEAD